MLLYSGIVLLISKIFAFSIPLSPDGKIPYMQPTCNPDCLGTHPFRPNLDIAYPDLCNNHWLLTRRSDWSKSTLSFLLSQYLWNQPKKTSRAKFFFYLLSEFFFCFCSAIGLFSWKLPCMNPRRPARASLRLKGIIPIKVVIVKKISFIFYTKYSKCVSWARICLTFWTLLG